jgi:hypothetical protein
MRMRILMLALLGGLAACGQSDGGRNTAEPAQVATSGKSKVALDQVPAEVLQAARSAREGVTLTEAEAETREGRRYFDIAGTLADGSEIEFDIMEESGRSRVVESQRDMPFAEVPAPVRASLAAADAKFAPTRVIESTQEDGVVIYELFGPANGDPQGRKVEIKWDGSKAELLTTEWAH